MTLLHASPPIIHNVVQGSEEWLRLRRGIITASTIGQLVTPSKLTSAQNDKARAHVRQLLAERVTDFIEPSYLSSDMERGLDDEAHMRAEYEKWTGRTIGLIGFVTREFTVDTEQGPVRLTLGCSPDGFIEGGVGPGMIEGKSRLAKHQIETILTQRVPQEHLLQVQCGLLVTGRVWCDYVSYCGGMHMATVACEPDLAIQDALLLAAANTELQLQDMRRQYDLRVRENGWPVTERHTPARDDEIVIGDDE